VVELAGSGPAVADGLGGVSFAVQLTSNPCACTSPLQCGPFGACNGGMCFGCNPFLPPTPGNILVSRFAP
jgi:hypothetical protein